MIADKLRKSILQAAIQGKLTEQLSSDGDVHELLDNIHVEERFPDDISFDLPNNWCWVRFGDVCHIARGGSPRPISRYITDSADGVNWIKIGDTDKNDKYINQTKEKIIIDGVSKSRMVHAGDLLLTNSMSFGRPYILNIDGCIHDGWLVFSQYEDSFNKDFLYHLITSKFVYYQFCGVVSGAVVKNLNKDKVADSVFPLPPLAEQQRIVERLEKVLPSIAALEKDESKLDTLQQSFPKKMKDSLLQAAIQGKLTEQLASDGSAQDLLKDIQAEKKRLIKEGKIKKERPLPEITEDEIPFDIPENWCWVRLGGIGNYRKGPFGSALTKSMFIPNGNGAVKVYEQKNAIQKDPMLGNYFISKKYYDEHMKGFTVRPKDIIISCAGTIGESYIMPATARIGIINQALMRVRLYNAINKSFFLLCFDYAIMHSSYKGKGTAIKNIPPFSILKNLVIPLPPLEEQKRIVARLEELLPKCDELGV